MTPRYHTVVCAIARNEDPFLLEWVAWHRMLGVEHFFIYDNVSDDGTSQRLMRLEDAGVLTRIHWPRVSVERPPQGDAYADFMMRHGAVTEFVGFLDLDEFVVPHQHASIPAMLKALPAGHHGLYLNWRIFGSSGQQERTPAPVIDRFRYAAPRTHRLNELGKVFVRPSRVRKVHIHFAALTHGCYQFDDQPDVTTPLKTIRERTPTHRWGQINHYMTKSAAEFARKKARGRAARGAADYRTQRDFELHDRNEELDLTAVERLPTLTASIAELEELERRHDPRPLTASIDIHTFAPRSIHGSVRASGDVQLRLVVNERHEYMTPAYLVDETPGQRGFAFSMSRTPVRPGDQVTVEVRGDPQSAISLTHKPPPD